MKTAAKVFIIIGMIFQFFFILPIVFGILALRELDEGKKSTWLGVCLILFCSTLGGVFFLISDVDQKKTSKTKQIETNHDEHVDLLRRYKQLLDDGVITQEEYDEKRREILDRM